MSTLSEKTPWRNGLWSYTGMSSAVFMVEGENWDRKSLIALDYPDIEGSMPLSIMKYGDFGAARKEIVEATGAETYNIEMEWYGAYKIEGVVNETGTAIHSWDETSKKVMETKWLTPESLEKLKEDRDDINTPR